MNLENSFQVIYYCNFQFHMQRSLFKSPIAIKSLSKIQTNPKCVGMRFFHFHNIIHHRALQSFKYSCNISLQSNFYYKQNNNLDEERSRKVPYKLQNPSPQD